MSHPSSLRSVLVAGLAVSMAACFAACGDDTTGDGGAGGEGDTSASSSKAAGSSKASGSASSSSTGTASASGSGTASASATGTGTASSASATASSASTTAAATTTVATTAATTAASTTTASTTVASSSSAGGGTCTPDVVISQFYSAGGNNGASLNADYVELHNRSGQAVSIAGWSIQYAPGGGNFGSMTDKVDLPAVSIPAGGFFLVQVSEPDPVDGAALPTPDFSFDIGMGANNGKIALVNTTTLLPAQACVAGDPSVVDLVGYAAAANAPTCWEGNPNGSFAVGVSTTDAAFRGANGCTDTGDNATDFAAAAAAPRNAATAPVVCNCP